MQMTCSYQLVNRKINNIRHHISPCNGAEKDTLSFVLYEQSKVNAISWIRIVYEARTTLSYAISTVIMISWSTYLYYLHVVSAEWHIFQKFLFIVSMHPLLHIYACLPFINSDILTFYIYVFPFAESLVYIVCVCVCASAKPAAPTTISRKWHEISAIRLNIARIEGNNRVL